MVGDRFLTDIVFGNRNRMLTIRPAPFTSKGEPKAVWAVSTNNIVTLSGTTTNCVAACKCARPQPRSLCLSERCPRPVLTPVLQARAVEQYCVDRWRGQGVQPPPHPLVPDPGLLSGFLRHPDEW